MEKCTFCCIGTGLDTYYDYGGEDLIFEDCIDLDKRALKSLDVLTLYNYCPFCGHKNNLEKYRGFTRYNLEDYIISGDVL